MSRFRYRLFLGIRAWIAAIGGLLGLPPRVLEELEQQNQRQVSQEPP